MTSRAGLGAPVRVPHGDDVINEGDTLVVAGSADALERLERLEAHEHG